jgi:hypothetical protein
MDSDEEDQIRQAAAGPKPRAPNRYRFKTFAERVNEVRQSRRAVIAGQPLLFPFPPANHGAWDRTRLCHRRARA